MPGLKGAKGAPPPPIDPVNFCGYSNSLNISFDPAKRARTLAERGLDFADAGLLLAADALDLLDEVFPIQLVIDALAMGEAAQQLRLLLRPDQDVGLIKVARASSRAI